MTETVVSTQWELDAALEFSGRVGEPIIIDSPREVVLVAPYRLSSSLEVRGESHVVVNSRHGSVTVFDRAHVEASHYTFVEARGDSSVRVDGRASASLFYRATGYAIDHAVLVAQDRASAYVQDAANACVFDHASVVAGGCSHVRDLRGAGHSGATRLGSDVSSRIRREPADVDDPREWAQLLALEECGEGRVYLYKATDDMLRGGTYYDKPTFYRVGTTVTATDWNPKKKCGNGLHLSPHPLMAGEYVAVPWHRRRFLRVSVAVSTLVPLSGDKAKVPECFVEEEVDHMGRSLTTATTA